MLIEDAGDYPTGHTETKREFLWIPVMLKWKLRWLCHKTIRYRLWRHVTGDGWRISVSTPYWKAEEFCDD